MAVKKQLVQIDKQIQGSLSSPGSGFVAFGAKSDGLYQRRNGQSEEKLAVETVVIIYQIGHGFAVGNAIKLSGSTWVKAKADSTANAGTDGIVTEVVDANNFKYSKSFITGSYTNGANYFLSPTTAGVIFIQSNPEVWSIGEVREFIGTGTPNGLDINIDVGQEITSSIIPVSIWDLLGINRTGWGEGKLLKFDAGGNLIVGVDLQGAGGTITLASLSGVSPISYNNTTGAFSIASGYSVPTTTEKANFQSAFDWGNHANAGYLKAITKALVEAVLTGNINTHTHGYDNYSAWNISLNDDWQMTFGIGSNFYLSFYNGTGIVFSRNGLGSNFYGIKADLSIIGLTTIANPSTNHYIAIEASNGPVKISLAQLQILIGGGGGGVTDHGALSGLGDDDHTQYYNQTRGDARFAQKAGSSSQAFSASTLTCASTATATNFILSDKRLKRRISKLKSLAIFDQIKWYNFELKSDNGQKRYGVIAQELELVAPEMVQENESGMKMVNYIDLLCAKVARLEERIKELEKML